ncbi:F-box/kelch-repeat protein At1g51550 [Malania oleifera]|uniref:F-box/kelch-repeat protein At1g51550 n=1 Tax=Malania oleifera TaxID=397392 RepID=UPI0025AE1685|nr:F-box/kelch-repeat protein At1g51550 [Malania oleifera]
MAESSSAATTDVDDSKSSITHVAQDHLFSILLLLPVDSILSFSMTCRRFRSLSCSGTLWESICRRDWGNAPVDALKSSAEANHHRLQLPWMNLYQQVYRLDTVSCYRLPHPDGEMLFPRPRASHSLNLVSDCLVLFGGGCEGGRHLDDTWVTYINNDFQRTLKWQRISSGIPNGRFGHTCAVIGDFLVLFGGINDHGVRQNDTWVGQLARHDTLGITLSWRLLDVGNIAPPPRGAHAGCCIDNRRLAIHGGIGLYGLRLGDTWVLDLSENLCFGTWHEIVAHPSPPARSGHTMNCVGGTQTVLFGGRGLGYEVLNDIWILNDSEGHLKWVQIQYDLQNIPGGPSLARVGHSATLIIGGQLLIYGGEDSDRHRKDDFWLLDVSAILPAETQHFSRKKGCSTNMWRRLKTKGFKPSCRSFHQACVDESGRCLYVFGGMVDGLLQPGESSALRFDGELFLVELMLLL